MKNVTRALKARAAGHKFQMNLPGDLTTIETDKVRLERILHNLIENAIKYSPENTTIKVSAREKDGHALISVADEGEGISPENQARIFEPFERLGDIAKSQGLGLGLVVCKRLVEIQGGKIWVESKPDKGSIFYFTLPVKERPA